MFETGLSDFHKLVVTVLESTFPKPPSKIMTSRCYKKSSNNLLRNDFKNYLLSKQNMTLEFTSLTRFTRIFTETRNRHAPIKKNILGQTTQILLHKAYGSIMLRSRLRNSFFKKNIWSLKRLTTNNATFALKFLKKAKKEHFQKNFTVYGDDNTPYFFDKNLEVILSKLQICALKLLGWFSVNYMEMNSDKCHLNLVLMMKVRK